MCGIVGVIADSDASKICYNSLEKLEYRGYDSAGIAGVNGEKINVFKKQGRVDNIKGFCFKNKDNIVIAHTRWATHGRPNEENAHPQLSFDKSIALVHNGIIENYQEIKNRLINQNISFVSETDTEVVCNLIATKNGSLLEKVQNACKEIVGSFAFAVIDNKSKEIVVAKNNSPLYVGFSENLKMVASDKICFAGKDLLNYTLEDGNFAVLTNKSVDIFDKNLNKIDAKFQKENLSDDEINLCGHKHYMEKEIFEIPAVIKRISAEYLNFDKIKNAVQLFNNINKIVLVACGTAYHASMYGAKVLKKATNKEADAFIASEFRYSSPIITDKTLAIFVSQSGETADTLAALKLCKENNAKTLAITNVPYSAIATGCDENLHICAGKEIGVASTKAYVAQILVLYILSKYIENNSYDISEIENLEENAKQMMFIDENIVKMVLSKQKVFYIGRQFDYISSLESALKLKEISYKSAEGYAAGELKHGTIALIEKGTPVFVFATDENLFDKTLVSAEEVKSRGAKVILISPKSKNSQICDYKIDLPDGLSTELCSIIDLIPMQLLALETTVKLGLNPDKPRNLAKSVTVE